MNVCDMLIIDRPAGCRGILGQNPSVPGKRFRFYPVIWIQVGQLFDTCKICRYLLQGAIRIMHKLIYMGRTVSFAGPVKSGADSLSMIHHIPLVLKLKTAW